MKTTNGLEAADPRSSASSNALTFPPDCIVGSLGQFAREMAIGTEVPEEFYFAAALTFFGATTVGLLSTESALNVEPRLYTVLLGESADVKKSTALQNTAEFFKSIWAVRTLAPVIVDGVGSAEGLGLKLADTSTTGVVLSYDELSAFIQKSKIESSLLLQMVSTLFERTCFENRTVKHQIKVEKGHLTLVGCCTTDTYDSMWTQAALAIGFPNRLLVVWAERKRKVAWPESRDPAKMDAIRVRLVQQLSKLPLRLKIDQDAKDSWQLWYDAVPSSIHAKRLDSIGFRLMMILTVTNDNKSIDLATVQRVTRILDYELRVRMLTDPINCENTIATLEEKIRRQLRQRGPISKAELIRYTNARRTGLWAFDAAFRNLRAAEHICEVRSGGKWQIWRDPDRESRSAESSEESLPSLENNFNGV